MFIVRVFGFRGPGHGFHVGGPDLDSTDGYCVPGSADNTDDLDDTSDAAYCAENTRCIE